MADWPTLDALKRALGVTTTDRDADLQAALDASVEQVEADCDIPYREEAGEVVLVSGSMSQAALLLAVVITKAPDAPYGVAAVFDTGGLTVAATHPTYTRLLAADRGWAIA